MLAFVALASSAPFGPASAETRFDGVTLNIASQNDQYAAVLATMAPKFTELTGAKVNVDILSYPELLTKITADYVGHTKGYDIATVDIVWSGQFAEAGYTVDLADWIKRDAAEIKVDALPARKRSSIAPSPPPNAAPRCWVRAFCTGTAASLSLSRVTTEESG